MSNILMLIYKISCGPSFLSYYLFFHHSFTLSSFHCYFIDPYTHVLPSFPHIHQYTRPSLHPHSSFIPSLLIPSLFHCSTISPFSSFQQPTPPPIHIPSFFLPSLSFYLYMQAFRQKASRRSGSRWNENWIPSDAQNSEGK